METIPACPESFRDKPAVIRPMQIALSAAPYQGLRRSAPEFYLPLPNFFAGLQFKGLAWISVVWDAELKEEIQGFRRFLHLPLDILVGPAPEYMREILSLEPACCTFANLQRADTCFDLLLFAEQVRELLSTHPVTRSALKVRLEPETDLVKAASKLGFSMVELDTSGLLQGKVSQDKFMDCLKTAEKLSMAVVFGAEANLVQLPQILRMKTPDVVTVGTPFYQIALRDGTEKAFESVKAVCRL
jgi:hypothetical protein